MFSVNDYVVYGNEGVCMVEDIGKPSISGLDKQKEYYTLVPFLQEGQNLHTDRFNYTDA
ncbi:MAG: CarD family transcriptional regulator [Oscillospiraceae bacterium]|nr:CarD family transcriptional regulator [Oscillospiraceae bacterium]